MRSPQLAPNERNERRVAAASMTHHLGREPSPERAEGSSRCVELFRVPIAEASWRWKWRSRPTEKPVSRVVHPVVSFMQLCRLCS